MKFVDLNGSRSFVNLNGALAFVKRAIKPAGYRILVDGKLFCSSKSEDLAVIDPVVTMEANKAGSCEFTIPPTHPMYSDIEIRKSVIEVFVKGRSVFRGFPIDIVTDFYKQKTVTCEGELSVFNDSVIRPTVWPSQSAYNLLTAILTAHNGQVDATKQMTVGTVTITGNIAYNSGYSTTMEVLKDLVDKHGGYVRVRRTAGVSYLDWLEASPNNNDQIIKIGKNLIDLSQTMTAADVVTRCVPLGAKLGTYTVPDVEDRLTINSVNSGLDYLDAAAAQAEYGIVTKVVEFDNITVASHLKTKGQNWLASEQFAGLVIEATAFDLNLADDQFEEFKLLDTVHVVSAPHGLNRTFVISKMTLNLNAPEKNTIQLGKEVVRSLTAKTADASTEIQRVSEASVSPNAVKGIIESAHGGTIYTHYDANGVADELYILDGATIATSTRWWRYNVNGWAYTPDAGQTYTVAADMTGKLTANDIAAGAVLANSITASNMNITGGSVDISTSSASDDKIILTYLQQKIYMSPSSMSIDDIDDSSRIIVNPSGIAFYTINGSGVSTGTKARYLNEGLYIRHPSGNITTGLSLDYQSMTIKDSSGNTKVKLDSNGLDCSVSSAGATSVTFSKNNTWKNGASISLQAGCYVVVARAKVTSDTAYCRFGVGVRTSSSTLAENYLGSDGSAVVGNTVAYNGTEIEATYVVKLSSTTTYYAAALSKGAGGGVGGSANTWLRAMRIG